MQRPTNCVDGVVERKVEGITFRGHLQRPAMSLANDWDPAVCKVPTAELAADDGCRVCRAECTQCPGKVAV